MAKRYLGDGAYAEFDGYGVRLTAENGIRATDAIYLEPAVIVALLGLLGQHYDRGKLCIAIGVEVDESPEAEASNG